MLRTLGKSLLLISLLWTLGLAGPQPTAGRVAPTAKEIQPLLPGMLAPDVTFFRTDGSPFHLREALTESPLVLIFYRGGW